MGQLLVMLTAPYPPATVRQRPARPQALHYPSHEVYFSLHSQTAALSSAALFLALKGSVKKCPLSTSVANEAKECIPPDRTSVDSK